MKDESKDTGKLRTARSPSRFHMMARLVVAGFSLSRTDVGLGR